AYIAASFSIAQQTTELADNVSTFFIAEVDGLAAGYAKLHAGEPAEGVEGAKPVELVRLYVAREWLGRGVGEALMRACVKEARRGAQTIGSRLISSRAYRRNCGKLLFRARRGAPCVRSLRTCTTPGACG